MSGLGVVEHEECACGCCGSSGGVATLERPSDERSGELRCRCACGCVTGLGCTCGCAEHGCACGCAA